LGNWITIYDDTAGEQKFFVKGLIVNGRKFLWAYWDNVSYNSIANGTTYYTVTDNRFKHTLRHRGLIIGDMYNGSSFLGRATIDVDYQTDGRFQFWIVQSPTSLTTGKLHGDIFVPID
jgi:hypothetical protein